MVDSIIRIPNFLRPFSFASTKEKGLAKKKTRFSDLLQKQQIRKRGHPSSLKNHHPVGEAWVVEIVCGGGVGSQEVRGYGGGLGVE